MRTVTFGQTCPKLNSRLTYLLLATLQFIKGGLISEGALNLVPLPIKGAKSLPGSENLNNLFYLFSVQWSDLAPFFGSRTKIKIPCEIKPPLTRFG